MNRHPFVLIKIIKNFFDQDAFHLSTEVQNMHICGVIGML